MVTQGPVHNPNLNGVGEWNVDRFVDNPVLDRLNPELRRIVIEGNDPVYSNRVVVIQSNMSNNGNLSIKCFAKWTLMSDGKLVTQLFLLDKFSLTPEQSQLFCEYLDIYNLR